MKHEKLQEALNQISDKHIAEATQQPKRHIWRWAAPVAAVLVIAILVGTLAWPFTTPTAPETPGTAGSQHLLFAPAYPQMSPYPDENAIYDGEYSEEKYQLFDLSYDNWKADREAQYDQPKGYADGTEDFFAQTLQQLLTGSTGENRVCSPLNIYMALAMLAETANGQSRQQILELLGSDSIEALRTQAGHVWNAHYSADNATFLTLANSLWLDGDLQYNEKTARILSDSYYASVFRGKLGSEEMNRALQSWLNEQTDGLLKEQVENVEMDPTTVLALASTIYYRCKWNSEFWEGANTEGQFHSPSGDQPVTFMNMGLPYQNYYWGDKFGAIAFSLEDGGKMWLFLPDEGYAPEALPSDPQVLALLQGDSYENVKGDMIVNLSLPKFDISSDMKLNDSLKAMGITDVFGPQADFSAILQPSPGMTPYLSEAQHAARVAIDEEGITAAAYTVMLECGAAQPPEDEIDFILDRPFLFVVESRDGLPLFAGIVNEP